jgi:flagellar hook-length control protein FliK
MHDDEANSSGSKKVDEIDSTQTVVNQSPTTRVDAAPASSAPAAPDAARLVRDIAEQVGVLAGQGKSEFQIQLHPDTLGRLHMRLTLDDGGVTVRMHAESAEAKSMIESNLGQLKQSFQDQGVRVDHFTIDVGQGQFSQDGQHPRRSRGWVDDVPSNRSSGGGDEFADLLAVAGGPRPIDFRV